MERLGEREKRAVYRGDASEREGELSVCGWGPVVYERFLLFSSSFMRGWRACLSAGGGGGERGSRHTRACKIGWREERVGTGTRWPRFPLPSLTRPPARLLSTTLGEAHARERPTTQAGEWAGHERRWENDTRENKKTQRAGGVGVALSLSLASYPRRPRPSPPLPPPPPPPGGWASSRRSTSSTAEGRSAGSELKQLSISGASSAGISSGTLHVMGCG